MGCTELQYDKHVSDVDQTGLESAVNNSNTFTMEHRHRNQEISLQIPEDADQVNSYGDVNMVREFVRMNRDLGANPVASAIFLQYHVLSEKE